MYLCARARFDAKLWVLQARQFQGDALLFEQSRRIGLGRARGSLSSLCNESGPQLRVSG
jgi:hypothetical protein